MTSRRIRLPLVRKERERGLAGGKGGPLLPEDAHTGSELVNGAKPDDVRKTAELREKDFNPYRGRGGRAGGGRTRERKVSLEARVFRTTLWSLN